MLIYYMNTTFMKNMNVNDKLLITYKNKGGGKEKYKFNSMILR